VRQAVRECILASFLCLLRQCRFQAQVVDLSKLQIIHHCILLAIARLHVTLENLSVDLASSFLDIAGQDLMVAKALALLKARVDIE